MDLKEILDSNEFQEKYEKLMMRGVMERYALFYQWGIEHWLVKLLDLTGRPLDCYSSLYVILIKRLDSKKELVEKVIAAISAQPIPEGLQ